MRITDRTKIKMFKNKVKKLTDMNQKMQFNKIDVLQDAMKDMNITEEPIVDHYTFGKALGSGKYGVVKLATSNSNPDFKVAVKVIDLEKLTGNYHS